jgi:ATP-dependent RNA helicase DeaD
MSLHFSEVCLTTATLEGPGPAGFHTLGLKPEVLAALERVGYSAPTPIQAAFIPHALAGKDMIGQAQTGTGKTAAFLLPYLHMRDPSEPVKAPRAIVLLPTRELVVQVALEAAKLAPDAKFQAVPIYGGARMGKQLAQLQAGCDMVIGTPGRVIDHLRRGSLVLDQVRYAVLDEADRMLDIGFRPDIERILKRCPQSRQTLLLSATMPPPVLKITERYMIEPGHVNVAPERLTVDKIRQSYITVDEDRKFSLLSRILDRDEPRQAIIFCERKRWCELLYRQLRLIRARTAVMHGDLSQTLRNRIMQGFRDGKIRFLVATDVVGRGIDVKNISHVFNYDIPMDPENYVHRIGRTGRIGADGIAIAFVTPGQGDQLTEIETFINKEIPEERVEGFQAYTPRARVEKPAGGDEEKKPQTPVYGRRVKKYSNRI